jgi:hypothetical protein
MRLPLWLRPRDTYFEEGSIPYLLLWWLSRDAWRIAFPAGHSLYAVAAYWELVKGKWVQLFAQTRTLPKQLDLLAALRSVHSRNPDTH